MLSNPVNATLQDGADELSAVGTITDDEPTVTHSAVNNEVEEGEDAVLRFTRTGVGVEGLRVYFRYSYPGGWAELAP